MTQFFAVLAVFGMACLVWLAYGWLLLPGDCPVEAVIVASGNGERLEHTVKGLLWLRKNRLWFGCIVIRDAGLDPEGMAVAAALARQEGIELRKL